jgi:hypothetical protein
VSTWKEAQNRQKIGFAKGLAEDDICRDCNEERTNHRVTEGTEEEHRKEEERKKKREKKKKGSERRAGGPTLGFFSFPSLLSLLCLLSCLLCFSLCPL